MQYHIKAISNNFGWIQHFYKKAKHIERFQLKIIKPSSGYYKH